MPGRYVSYWRLRDDKGELFGNSMWVEWVFSNFLQYACSDLYRSITVAEATREPSDHSLASSSIIMPNPPRSHSLSLVSSSPTGIVPPTSSTADGSSITEFPKRPENSDTLSEYGDDDSSSASLISIPSSDEEDEAELWEASRTHAPAVEGDQQSVEYVLLYDDNTSGEEDCG